MKVLQKQDIPKTKPRLAQIKTMRVSELFNEVLARYRQKKETVYGIASSSWPVFNASFGGAREGELITVTADTGVGKSTFLLNWFMDFGKLGVPALMLNLEVPWKNVAAEMAQMITGQSFRDFTDQHVRDVGVLLEASPLWFVDCSGYTDEAFVLDLMDYASKELGVKVIFIDHFDYITKKWDGRNESYIIGECIRRISTLSRDLGLTTVLVAHPSSLKTATGKKREVGLDDLRGSSSIKQESDAVFGLSRPDPSKPVTQLRFLKIRHHSYGHNVWGKVRFQYNFESFTYSELSLALEQGE